MRKALITGITGQDGSYLADFLLSKGYQVHGLIRRSSSFNTERVDHIFQDPHETDSRFRLWHGDLTDGGTILNLLATIRPDEIYHLGAQSHVRVSFDMPEFTADTIALGTLRLLEAIRHLKLPCKFYQASSSEMYGASPPIQDEHTPFRPRSPYAAAKVFAHHMTVNYREAYGIFACSGILFNHESPRRGETFVTRKITRGLARIHLGASKKLYLGNLDAKRDWGYAKDYVEAMWLMLQQPVADDYILATGETHSVREFAEQAAAVIGFDLVWDGEGLNEVGIDRKSARTIIAIDARYYRPAEVDVLLGDCSKARAALGWRPRVLFPELIEMMVRADVDAESRKLAGARIPALSWPIPSVV